MYERAGENEKSLKRYVYKIFFNLLNRVIRLPKKNKDFLKLEERLVFGLLKQILNDESIDYFSENDVSEYGAVVGHLYRYIFRYISGRYTVADEYLSLKEPGDKIKELKECIASYLTSEEREKLTEILFLAVPVFFETLFWGKTIADDYMLEKVLNRPSSDFLLKTLISISRYHQSDAFSKPYLLSYKQKLRKKDFSLKDKNVNKMKKFINRVFEGNNLFAKYAVMQEITEATYSGGYKIFSIFNSLEDFKNPLPKIKENYKELLRESPFKAFFMNFLIIKSFAENEIYKNSHWASFSPMGELGFLKNVTESLYYPFVNGLYDFPKNENELYVFEKTFIKERYEFLFKRGGSSVLTGLIAEVLKPMNKDFDSFKRNGFFLYFRNLVDKEKIENFKKNYHEIFKKSEISSDFVYPALKNLVFDVGRIAGEDMQKYKRDFIRGLEEGNINPVTRVKLKEGSIGDIKKTVQDSSFQKRAGIMIYGAVLKELERFGISPDKNIQQKNEEHSKIVSKFESEKDKKDKEDKKRFSR